MIVEDRPLGSGRGRVDVILISRDSDYASDLASFLNEQPGDVKLTATLASPDQLQAVMQPGRQNTVLLVDDEDQTLDLLALAKDVDVQGVGKTILLVSSLRGRTPPGSWEIMFKYAMGSSLLERLRSLPAPVVAQREAETLHRVIRTVPAGSHLFSVISPKGGSGCSTIAANLALLFAGKGQKVALVDLAQYGSQQVIFRQPPRGQGLWSMTTLLAQEPDVVGTERFRNQLSQALLRVDINGAAFHLLPAAASIRMEQIGASMCGPFLVSSR